MIIHNDPLFQIFFGSAKTQFNPKDFYNKNNSNFLQTWPFTVPVKKLHLKQLIFLKQDHDIHGISVRSQEQAHDIKPFSQEGDFLVTNLHHIGLAVVSADCLPIVFFDSLNHVIAIAHAGWRGSIKGIAVKALERMKQDFETRPEYVRVFFGPSSKACCYEVGSEVLQALDRYSFKDDVIHTINGKYMFDIPLFNKILLEEAGIPKNSFKLNYNLCTQCDVSFCSARREKEKEGRQMTVVALK